MASASSSSTARGRGRSGTGAGGGAGAGAGAGAGGAASVKAKGTTLPKKKKPKQFRLAKAVLPEDALAPGSGVIARFRDGTLRRAVIIEKRTRQDELPDLGHAFDYYVHFKDFNRRMDSWLRPNALIVDKGQKTAKLPCEQDPEDAKDADDKGSAKSRKRKRKDDKEEEEEEEKVIDGDGPAHDEHEGMDEASIREHEEVTKVKNVNFIRFGKHKIEAWYYSPFPKEYHPHGVIETLHYCEFCLSFFRYESELITHAKLCKLRYPPGSEIYRNAGISMFEVDGAQARFYCQNLCYLAKCFLDHKTLYYDVVPFLFYVMCELDEHGYHVVGYYSKEKYSEQGFNLACILTLPPYQRKGYGRFLIQFSYALSQKEYKVGSPEKPLSDLGLLSYRSYWSWVLLNILHDYKGKEISIMDMTKITSITNDDIINTLQYLGLIKYWNGNHIISVTPELIESKWKRLNSKKGPIVDPSKLHWAPLRVNVRRDKWSIKAKKAAADDS